MKYTVFIENGYGGLQCLGELTKEQIEELTVTKSLTQQGISKEDLTIVAGEIVELW